MTAESFHRAYISLSPSAGEPKVEAMLPVLLRLGVMPVWPKPRADWTERKALLESCDYLLLFSGHSYISRPPSGVSWQHREFNHACIRKIPVFAALLDETLLSQEQDVRARLELFRNQLQKYQVVTWSHERELPARLAVAWPVFARSHPSPGWVRAPRQTPGQGAVVASPERSLESKDPADWMHQRENFSFRCLVYVHGNCIQVEKSGLLSWEEVCRVFLGPMSPRASEDKIHRGLAELLRKSFRQRVLSQYDRAHAATDFQFTSTSLRKIRLKLRREGLIRKDTQASGRHQTVWVITDHGRTLLQRQTLLIT